MVNVTNGAYVDVRLGELKFFLGHVSTPKKQKYERLMIATAAKNTASHEGGAHGGNRTRDLSLTKGVLYH